MLISFRFGLGLENILSHIETKTRYTRVNLTCNFSIWLVFFKWPPDGPLHFRFGKSNISAFTGKKIMIFSCVSQILSYVEYSCWNWPDIVQIEISGKIIELWLFAKISFQPKIWTKKDENLIFFSSESWDVAFFKSGKGGPGEDLFQ